MSYRDLTSGRHFATDLFDLLTIKHPRGGGKDLLIFESDMPLIERLETRETVTELISVYR